MANSKTGSAPRLGAHMSTAGGLHEAFDRAVEVGCECLQVFVKNQRQWSAKKLSAEEIGQWQQARQRSGLGPVIAHATYLINLGSSKQDLWEKSVKALGEELQRCETLGIILLVFHPGAHVDQTLEEGIARVVEGINEIHQAYPDLTSRLALECTAGQGQAIGHRLEHLADIINQVEQPNRLAVCLDTCHLFAAGYPLSDPADYSATMQQVEQTIGRVRVACFHLNDSMKGLGSRVDRHAAIGEGQIGLGAFRNILLDPRWRDRPMVLETPKGEDNHGVDLDRVNLGVLRGLLA
ncbi:MAG: Endonuclease 4 [Phycisphaerae bacterium]|nr:Endonuclease 4 [Phycisphaerae bacterium]